MAKYIFVTGGVVSGLGKGISAACLGHLLKSRGLKVFVQKFDPYINVDPGTMSPIQHGEVFVTADGTETDLDLGHYERFIDLELSHASSITTGKVYDYVIKRERRGDYLGATVQVVPHITNEIQRRIFKAAEESQADIIISEIGGTVGDIESLPYIESLRQLRHKLGPSQVCFVHVTLVPYLETSNEYKTKPTQHSVKELGSLGISPDFIILRSREDLSEDIKSKVSLFCDVPENHVVLAPDVKNIYEMPLIFKKQKFDEEVCKQFGITSNPSDTTQWEELVYKIEHLSKSVRIALVGKYTANTDAYLSVIESLRHAGYAYDAKVDISLISAEDVTDTTAHEILKDFDGIVVPGGFGRRGIPGKISTAKYAREHKVPYLGLCLGMQIALIEIAQNVLNLKAADSTEWGEGVQNPVIDLMSEQKTIVNKGGTMRLGNYDCALLKGSKAYELYGEEVVKERHRHRYEFNNSYKEAYENVGVVFSGVNPLLNLVEMMELKDHPFFLGTQAHPEFKSRPNRAHPLFLGLIKASLKEKK